MATLQELEKQIGYAESHLMGIRSNIRLNLLRKNPTAHDLLCLDESRREEVEAIAKLAEWYAQKSKLEEGEPPVLDLDFFEAMEQRHARAIMEQLARKRAREKELGLGFER